MFDTSNRQHDAFDNPAKALCRAGNLRVLREAAHLLWRKKAPSTPAPPPAGRGEKIRLRCDWCELMGTTVLLTLDLLEREGVLAAGGFVGVDLDAGALIDGFRRVPARFEMDRRATSTVSTRMRPSWPTSVSSISTNTARSAAAAQAETDFPLIHGPGAGRGLERFGEFALFWNQDLDSGAWRAAEQRRGCERRHVDMAGERSARLPSRAAN